MININLHIYIFHEICSFVLASYARFLWDAEEEDDEEEKAGEKFSNGSDQSFFHGAPPLAAAS